MFFPQFVEACSSGNREEAEELYNTNNIGVSDMKQAFRDCCTMGELEMAEWVLNLEPKIAEMSEFIAETFYLCTHYDLFESVNYLIRVKPDIDISIANDELFRRTCSYGQFEMAKLLYSLKPTINISSEDEFAFRHACSRGDLETAKWLLSINPRINISANSDEAYRNACLFGRFDVSQWLLSMKEMDDSVHKRAFESACVMKQPEVIKFYCDNRDKYGAHVIDIYNNNITV